MIKYIFGAGAVLGLAVGYKVGHAIGKFTPQRKLNKIRKALGRSAEEAKKKVQKTTSQVKKTTDRYVQDVELSSKAKEGYKRVSEFVEGIQSWGPGFAKINQILDQRYKQRHRQ